MILAPMEDVTNPPFRKFCKKYGADWLYSEFVSADALVRSVNKSLKKLTIDETERPVTIQIYGRFIDSMVDPIFVMSPAVLPGDPALERTGRGSP